MNDSIRITPARVDSQAIYLWRQALPALVALLLLTLLLYRETGLAMVQIWSRSDTFAHAFFVLPISLWLIWRKRALLSRITPKSELMPLIFLLGMVLLWYLGMLASVNALTQFAFVAMLVLTVPAMLGWRITSAIMFPLGFLFFSVPLGEFLMPQLMDWTASVTVSALRLTGIPVYREGLQFIISSGHWSVVEACSGIRYLIASLTVGTLYSYLSFTSVNRRLWFIALSILVPVIANWMRAYLIVLLGHISGNKLAAGFDHLIYGWVFFGVVIFSMFIIGARWSEPELALGLAIQTEPTHSSTDSRLKIAVMTFIFSLFVSVPIFANFAFDLDRKSVSTDISLPFKLGHDWELIGDSSIQFRPSYKSPDAEGQRMYSDQGQAVGLYIGLYKHQNSAIKMVSSSNVLVTSQDLHWTQLSQGTTSILIDQNEHAIKTTVLQKAGGQGSSNPDRLLTWKFYWIGGQLTANDYLAKVYAVWRRITGRDDDSAVIILYTKDESNAQASATLTSFLRASYDSINSILTAHVNN